MNTIRVIFFGSTADSVIVLQHIHKLPIGDWTLDVVGVVTQPPKPVGRNQTITPTPVEIWAKAHQLPVLSFPAQPDKPALFASPQQVIDTLAPLKASLVISACYGQKIPVETIQKAQHGGLNVHPSLLPRWRGADPVPWAILAGDHQTGVSVVTLGQTFDAGLVLSQKKVPIARGATPDALRSELFTLGADLLTDALPDYLSDKHVTHAEDKVDNQPEPYARRFTRDDGFVPWTLLTQALQGADVPPPKRSGLTRLWPDPVALVIERMLRALTPWPGVWTEITIHNDQTPMTNTQTKRVKILEAHMDSNRLVIDTVQLEGKNPVSFQQFAAAYVPT